MWIDWLTSLNQDCIKFISDDETQNYLNWSPMKKPDNPGVGLIALKMKLVTRVQILTERIFVSFALILLRKAWIH